MKLNQSPVLFDQEAHTYTLDGVRLEGITGMLSRQLFPDKYVGVPDFVLQRAAEHGSFVHEVCELVDDLGISHDSEEARNYQQLKAQHSLHYEASEYLVSDNKHFASSIDKVYRESDDEFSLADIKTTCTLDTEYVRWQLSIYAYLFELQNPGCRVKRLFAIWLRGGRSALVEVERIPVTIVSLLLTCEVNGEQFANPLALPATSEDLPAKYQEMEQAIIEIDHQEKYWKEQRKKLLDGVMQEMQRYDVYKWNGGQIQFTRKKDSTRQVFDREAFERDYPGVYNKYLKETTVTGSVTLKVL